MDPKNKMSRSDWEEYTKRYGLLGQQNYIEEKEREKREKEEERREAAALAIQITWRRYIKKRREKEEKEIKEKMEWNFIQEKERERREQEKEENEKREAESREGAPTAPTRPPSPALSEHSGEDETREGEELTQMLHSELTLSDSHEENSGRAFMENNKKEGAAREDEEEDRQRKAKEESEKERMRGKEELTQTFARRERNVRLHKKPPLLSPNNRFKKLGKRFWNFLTGRRSPSRVEADGGDRRGGAQRRERQEEDFKELSPQEEMRGGTWTISPEHNDNDEPEK